MLMVLPFRLSVFATLFTFHQAGEVHADGISDMILSSISHVPMNVDISAYNGMNAIPLLSGMGQSQPMLGLGSSSFLGARTRSSFNVAISPENLNMMSGDVMRGVQERVNERTSAHCSNCIPNFKACPSTMKLGDNGGGLRPRTELQRDVQGVFPQAIRTHTVGGIRGDRGGMRMESHDSYILLRIPRICNFCFPCHAPVPP